MPQSHWSDEPHEAEVHVPLTGQEAEVLIQKLGAVKLDVFLTTVLVWQLSAAVSMGVLVWWLWPNTTTAVSVFYGALCAALPSALVAFVVKRRMSANILKHPGDALLGLLVLELVKVVAAVCMLFAAPLALEAPQWVAVVAGFVLTLKIYWLVALLELRHTSRIQILR